MRDRRLFMLPLQCPKCGQSGPGADREFWGQPKYEPDASRNPRSPFFLPQYGVDIKETEHLVFTCDTCGYEIDRACVDRTTPIQGERV